MSRKLQYAYNPETGKWHLRAGNMDKDYIGDRESVKTFYAFESTQIGLSTLVASDREISDLSLDLAEARQNEQYAKWKKDNPNLEFPLFG